MIAKPEFISENNLSTFELRSDHLILTTIPQQITWFVVLSFCDDLLLFFIEFMQLICS